MIEIKNLTKTFNTVDHQVEALKNINLTINDGEVYGIIGMSGAGKSTLVRCINMLERPTEGDVIIDGKVMNNLSPKELRQARTEIAMIFQSFNLLMQRNCLDNICFPLELAGVKRSDAVKRAKELLDVVGLPDKAKSYPSQLSGGQQQRIAIARALAVNPKVLLCDEATSALDPKTTHSILELIRDINKKLNITVIIITHQMSVVEQVCDKVAILDHGTVAEVGVVSEVFSHPQSDAAKRLVFPESNKEVLPNVENQRMIRIVFNGSRAAGEPLISSLAINEKIVCNILYASTRLIGDKVYGNMLLGLENNQEIVSRAIDYISKDDSIVVQEVEFND